MKNKIYVRQLCVLLGVFLPVSRVVLLPSYLSGASGKGLLFPAVAYLALEFCAIWLGLYAVKNSRATAFETLRSKLGRGGAVAVWLVLAVYLVFSAVLPVCEHRLYVQYTMYDALPTLTLFLPFFLFTAYALAKGLRSLGRGADAALFLFLIAFPVLLIMGAVSADFTRLLPLLTTPSEVLRGVKTFLPWSNVGAWLPLLAGKVDTTPELKDSFYKKTLLSYTAGVVALLAFLATFYGVYGPIGVTEKYAVARIASYYEALKTLGRVDYIFLYTLAVVQLFALLPPLLFAVECLLEAFPRGSAGVWSIVVTAVLLLAVLFAGERFLAFFEFERERLFPLFALFLLGVPAAGAVILRGKRRKNENDRR